MFKKHIRKMNSYSQSGEDMIINFLFECRGIEKPTYLDVGANDPYLFSNTAFFYEKGSRGINIDANPVCIEKFKRIRKGDVNLNVGIVVDGNKELEFYVMNPPTMSTFSKEAAYELVERGNMSIDKTIIVPTVTVKDVIQKYNDNVFPDIFTIDAEGLDVDILKTINFNESAPKVICVETKDYWASLGANTDNKGGEIKEYLDNFGFIPYADTGINTIFINSQYFN